MKRGNIICGGFARGPASIETNRATVLPEAMLGQMEQLRRVMPSFARVSMIRSWSGIESYLPDDVPIMGSSVTTPGLFYAFGFCGAGFQIGPGVGDVMAELIARGATATPIAQYGISRFATPTLRRTVKDFSKADELRSSSASRRLATDRELVGLAEQKLDHCMNAVIRQ